MNDGAALPWTFEPVVYQRGRTEKFLRIREIPIDELTGPAVIKICFNK
jgi:hypothetical protein